MERVSKEKVDELINRLRIVRVDKGLTYQEISKLTEELGESVSPSTVKRIFTDIEPKVKWRTLRSVANAVLGVGFDTPVPDERDPDQPKRYYEQIEALKLVVEAKSEIIAANERNLAFLHRQLRRQQIATMALSVVSCILLIVLVTDLFIL